MCNSYCEQPLPWLPVGLISQLMEIDSKYKFHKKENLTLEKGSNDEIEYLNTE